MSNEAALVSTMKVATMMLLILGTGVEAAPTERDPIPSLTHSSTVPEKPSGLNPSKYLKQWLLSTKPAGVDETTKNSDKTTTRTITAGIRAGQSRIRPGTVNADKRAQMLKMISALEELHRTFNSTLSTWITMPRANSRNSGKKNKVLPAADGGLKPTTAAPASDDSASRASTDVIVPSLTGRNFRKSLPPQPKKTNKRVCFWKYCSQN
ncbi:hypothetical protein PAMA_014501 [Pampus argenteus]